MPAANTPGRKPGTLTRTRIVYGPEVRVTWPWGEPPRTLRSMPTARQLAATRKRIKAESDAAMALIK